MTPRKEDRIAVIRHIVSQRGKRCRHTFGQIELIKNITLVVPFPRSRNAIVERQGARPDARQTEPSGHSGGLVASAPDRRFSDQ